MADPLDPQLIAKVCHEANRAYCESLGDHSQPSWGDAPDWQKDSALAGVNFHLRHPHAGDASSHEQWLTVKRMGGWKWGPEKDPVALEHPCMVPFERLPKEQQRKDALFRAVVHALTDERG